MAQLRRRPRQHEVLPRSSRSTPRTSATSGWAWRWRSADGSLDLDALRERLPRLQTRMFQATPLMAGGVLYISTPLHQVAAIDAATGTTIWVHDPRAYLGGQPTHFYNSRGVAYWTDGDDARIFFGTNEAYLIALDADTGAPVRDFGDDGRVDLMAGIPRAVRGETNHRGRNLMGVASPPIVAHDVVVTPNIISDGAVRKEAPSRLAQGDRRPHRRHEMDVPYRAAGGRLRRRQLGQRVVALLGQHERLVDADGRRRNRLRLPADRHADRRLLRRPPAGRQPVRREPGRARHRDRPADVALPGGAPRRLGLRLPRRAQPHRHHRRRPSHQGDRPGEQAGLHLRLRPPSQASRSGRSRNGRSRPTPTSPETCCRRPSPSRRSRRRSSTRA